MATKSKREERVPVSERLLLSIKDAAAYLSISRSQLDTFRADGDIRAIRAGSRVMFRRSECERLADKLEAGETLRQRKIAEGV